ncbi:MAG: hypothetical protein HS119_11195 [Flavobacteriales bacterium]|nr:hypothetical protein [Flavobacteriales bacterium]
MAKKGIKYAGLKSLEDSFSDKTTENIINPSKKEEIDTKLNISGDNEIKSAVPVTELSSSNEQQIKVSTTEQSKPVVQQNYDSFQSFFNKNFEWKNAEQMNVNRDIKRILEKLASFRKDTTQVSLVSNILKAWIDEHKPEIQRVFKENTKIDF